MARVTIHVDIDSKQVATQLAALEKSLENQKAEVQVSANTTLAKEQYNRLILSLKSQIEELQGKLGEVWKTKGDADAWYQYSSQRIKELEADVERLNKVVKSSGGNTKSLVSGIEQIGKGADTAATSVQNLTNQIANLFDTVQRGMTYSQSMIMGGLGGMLMKNAQGYPRLALPAGTSASSPTIDASYQQLLGSLQGRTAYSQYQITNGLGGILMRNAQGYPRLALPAGSPTGLQPFYPISDNVKLNIPVGSPYGGKSPYRATGTNIKNDNVVFIDSSGNVSYKRPINDFGASYSYTRPEILALPAGNTPNVKIGNAPKGDFFYPTQQLDKQKGFFEDVLGTSLGNYITRLSTYQMVSGAIYGTVQSFKDALGTIKEVDSELASIQKVTDFTADQMAEIEEGAYSVASKYGVSAQDYLESVSAFAKAGYKDLADDLGELAIKTQLVGDVTADTANKFLLSVDAAWKMGGSVDDLSRVLDEANVVENNYATSIDKLAQGLPNVASVASMAGMSAEETIAALGTITAVTQQSGTKAATALRALILNIMKDTTTEVEEGVTVTKEQISTLDEVLQTYASDAIKAAEATGEIVNPMEVVSALAQAYQENKITDRDLAKIEMALGGKLRTNQLDALLKNFGMYEEMMSKISVSAGSADKEIEIMLDTWEAKANILKNTWTEFVTKTVSSDFFKNILDGATKLLNVIGDLGTALGAVASFGAAKFMAGLPERVVKITAAFDSLKFSLGGFLSVAGFAITAAITALHKYREDTKNNAEETFETAKASAEQRDSIISLVNAYEQAAEGSREQKEASAQLASALGLEGDAVNSLAQDYQKLTAAKAAQTATDAAEAKAAAEKSLLAENNWSLKSGVITGGFSLRNYSNINDIIDINLGKYENNGLYRVRRGASKEEILAFYDALESAINGVKNATEGLTIDQQTDIFNSAKYQSLKKTYDSLTESVNGYRDAYKLWAESEATDKIFKDKAKGLIDTQEEFESYRRSLNETFQDEESLSVAMDVLKKMFPQFSGYVDEATAALAEEEKQLASTTSALDRYKKAMSTKDGEGKGEKDDNFKTVAGAFDTLQKESKNKRYASNAYQESAKLVLGENYLKTHDAEETAKHIKDLQKWGVFDEDSSGRGLYNLIKNTEGVEKTAEGYYEIADGLAAVKKNADGTFDFHITDKPEELLQVADALGVSAEALITMQQAMGVFSGDIDVEGLQTLLNTIDEIDAKSVDEKSIEYNTNADTVSAQIETLAGTVAKPAGTYNIEYNISVNGSIPMFPKAAGDSNFQGGLAYVNDQKGGFNPELIEANGKSFFVNNGKPALISLPKGAIIHNATETRAMFSGGITEVPHFDDGTKIPLGKIAERSGKVAGIGGGKGSAGSKDWWEKLQQYMEDLLEKAGDALDKQLEAIDAELFYLQYGKEVSEKATELEEARMDLLEAEQELINAQTERTVRYFNAETGQWEWMADQKDILKAQEDLADKQKDYLKAQYDYLEDVWKDLKDDIQKAIDGKKDVNIANVLKQMMKSKAGGLTGNVEGVIGDLLNLITALSNGTALDTYDSGGIASGLGYMYKATKADEVVLNGGLSNAILSPKRSQQFADFTSSLERMFGMASMMERPQSRMGISTNDSHNNIVYMNGIKIGSDMLNRPLSEVLSVLPIYCN